MAEKDIHDFLIKLSPEDSSSLDDLLSSVCSNSKELFTSLTPLLFQPEYSTIAQSILTSILQKKPNLLSTASSCIHSHVLNLQPLDEFVVPTPLLRLIVTQLNHTHTKHNSAADATRASEVLQHLCHIRMRTPLVDNVVSLLHPIPNDSTIMIRYYSLLLKIIPQIHMEMDVGLEPDVNGNSNTNGNDASSSSSVSLWKPFLDGMRDESDPLLQMSLLELLDVSERDDLLRDWKELDPILYQMVGVNVNVNVDAVNVNGMNEMEMDGDDDDEKELHINGNLHPFCAGAALRILAKRHIPSHHYIQILHHFAREMSGEVEKIGFLDGISTFCQQSDEHLNAILGGKEGQGQGQGQGQGKGREESSFLLEEWLNLRRVGQSKLKVIIMNSIARVISSSTVKDDELCMALYQAIGTVNDVGSGSTTTEIIMEYAKSQVIELRLGAYELLTAVVAHTKRGAHGMMRYHGGFFEFLCNRDLEDVKEGKELKHDLVKAVLHSDVRGLLASDVVKVLERVVEDGPYYVKNARDVALE